ncbi:MAG: hypothetical protein KDA54_18765, partial [Phycisphaerales bacterium]|nr:hypothetical protein [Phycisphaerales bacterium]
CRTHTRWPKRMNPFAPSFSAKLRNCSSTYTKTQTNQANRRSGNQPERNWPTSEVCLRGPGGRLLGGCECLDLDDDGDNDLQDFLIFLQAMN